jgi:PAS domain S-box-containing protein
VEFISTAYRVDNREVMQLNVREITDLVAAEHERDELSARLSHYLATSPTITYSFVLRDGVARWRWVSENIAGILGYSSEEALAPDWWFENVSTADRMGVLNIISDLAKTEVASREYRFMKKDGSVIWLHDEMRFLSGNEGPSEVVGTLTDITERKKAEEEIQLKSAALEATANAVVIIDRDGFIRWANPAFGRLTGYVISEAIGKKPKDLVSSDRQDDEFYRAMWNTILAGRVWSGQLVNRRKSGELYDEEMTITPVLDANRRVGSFVAVKTDITERVLSRSLLESALREKNALLREIHHRVNNNMQVIISLLNISARDLADSSLRDKLDDITRRMHSMAIIHEQFYQTEDMSHIDFASYLHSLLDMVGADFPESSRNAIAVCEKGQALLTLEQAIPAGLIVAELLSNALKHAFSDGREIGTIRITQKPVVEGRLEIEVRDDGKGFPDGMDPKQVQSMGMMLIKILSDQLGGDVAFRSDGGTCATLRFKIELVSAG